jgi:ATP-dependent protease Clp ATPase subunit
MGTSSLISEGGCQNRGTGARGLRSIVSSIFDRKVFDINSRTKVVKITKQDILELYAKQLEDRDNETTII